MEQLATDRIVGPVERDLLYFLLNYGSDELEFESDSEFLSPDGSRPTVTDFIAGTIDSDGGALVNPAYQKVYATYLAAYDEGRATAATAAAACSIRPDSWWASRR